MKRFFMMIAAFGACISLAAQEIAPETDMPQADTTEVVVVEDLRPLRVVLEEPDMLTGATVRIVEHGSAAMAVAEFEAATDSLRTIAGYRVRIFSDNSQTARAGAFAAQARLSESYNVVSDVVYENPYYLVTCGNCATKEEALMLLAQIKAVFPKAFIVSSDIAIKDLR